MILNLEIINETWPSWNAEQQNAATSATWRGRIVAGFVSGGEARVALLNAPREFFFDFLICF